MWMRKIWNKLTAFIAPFLSIARSLTSIAEDLRILRELHELDLSSRHPPIWRITEHPGPSDTEIMYSSDPPKRPNPLDSEEDENFEEINFTQ